MVEKTDKKKLKHVKRQCTPLPDDHHYIFTSNERYYVFVTPEHIELFEKESDDPGMIIEAFERINDKYIQMDVGDKWEELDDSMNTMYEEEY